MATYDIPYTGKVFVDPTISVEEVQIINIQTGEAVIFARVDTTPITVFDTVVSINENALLAKVNQYLNQYKV